MIHVGLLHDEIRRNLNKINGNYKTAISTIDIDGFINQAIQIVKENYSVIVERNRIIGDRLKSLEKVHQNLLPVFSNELLTRFSLPSDHYSTLSRRVKAKKEDCEESLIFVDVLKNNQIDECLRNPNCTPNYNWREAFCNDFDKYIDVYHNNDMKITNLNINYLRDIPKVRYLSGVPNRLYVLSDGTTIFEDKHLEIDDWNVATKICELALVFINRANSEDYRPNVETILFSEKVFAN